MEESSSNNIGEFQLFIENNKQYLQERYSFYFAKEVPLTEQQTPAIIKFISQVFSFDKYQEDSETSAKINESLTSSINHYISDHKDLPLTFESALSIISHTIQHTSIFSVQYDSHNNSEEGKTALNIQVRKQKHQNPEQQNLDSPKTKENHKENEERSKQFEQNASQFNHLSQSGQVEMLNEFELQEDFLYKFDPKTVRKNAKVMFNFYCKQQMELGAAHTFDAINIQASSMTLGKCLVFAKSLNFLNEIITREVLTSKFKKVSGGQRAVDFDKFYIMLSDLQVMDPGLFQRLHFNDESIDKYLKVIKYAFDTKDQQTRELIPKRHFLKKLTNHSGKTNEDLEAMMQQKNSQRSHHLLEMHSKPSLPRYRQKILSPKDLSTQLGKHGNSQFSVELSFIGSIVHPEESDHKYLGEYGSYSPHKVGESMRPHRSSNELKNRQQGIIEDIHKRIQELETKGTGKKPRFSNAKRL